MYLQKYVVKKLERNLHVYVRFLKQKGQHNAGLSLIHERVNLITAC